MTPIKAAAEPSREFVEELRKYWSFDNDQMHTHSWHDRENFIARKLPSLLAKFAPAGNAGVRERLETIANEVIGIQEDLPSEDDRNTLGFAAHYLRKFAALPQPREAFADEIKRADAAPPEASFDNASDMLGYLNAPREAEPVDACVEGREDLLLIAHEIKEARKAFLDGFGQVGNAARKEKLTQVLWDDAVTIANALEAYASRSPIPEAPVVREEIKKILYSYHGATLSADEAADRIIRALKPQDGGKCEHGIAKVNCGICVPSEVFSKLQDGGETGNG